MSYLPQLTILGRLKTLEVYEYYDIPRLFSCRNGSGQHYLALSIDEEDFSQTWLYVALSQERFQKLRLGQLELRDAYLDAEDQMVFKVITYQESHDMLERVDCTDIPEDWLPLAGEVLSSSIDTDITRNDAEVYLKTQLA